MNYEKISEKDNTEFVKRFLTKYMQLGFGNLPKKEIDILVFDLITSLQYVDTKNSFILADELGITTTRLRRLQTDVMARNSIDRDENAYKESIKKLRDLIFSKDETKKIVPYFDKEKDTVSFSISDVTLQRDFQRAVQLLGYSYDLFLNPEKIEVPLYVFVAVICECDEKNKKIIKQKYKEQQKLEEDDEKITQNKLLEIAKIVCSAIPIAGSTLDIVTKLGKLIK